MDQTYRKACKYLKGYQYYASVIEQPFIDMMGLGKPRRREEMEIWCKQVNEATDAITDQRLADLIRNEFIDPSGSREIALTKSGYKESQFCKIRRRAVLEWWRIINEL